MSTTSGWHADPDGDAIVDEEDEATYDEAFGPGRHTGHVGRLVEDDEGAHPDVEKDAVAHEASNDTDGYSAEESAMHLEPEDGEEWDAELADPDQSEGDDAAINEV
jgi:hypothetical protein